MPAKVYPVSGSAEAWLVEPPASDNAASDSKGRKTFSGTAALLRALEYAHRTYGSARYICR